MSCQLSKGEYTGWRSFRIGKSQLMSVAATHISWLIITWQKTCFRSTHHPKKCLSAHITKNRAFLHRSQIARSCTHRKQCIHAHAAKNAFVHTSQKAHSRRAHCKKRIRVHIAKSAFVHASQKAHSCTHRKKVHSCTDCKKCIRAHITKKCLVAQSSRSEPIKVRTA